MSNSMLLVSRHSGVLWGDGQLRKDHHCCCPGWNLPEKGGYQYLSQHVSLIRHWVQCVCVSTTKGPRQVSSCLRSSLFHTMCLCLCESDPHSVVNPLALTAVLCVFAAIWKHPEPGPASRERGEASRCLHAVLQRSCVHQEDWSRAGGEGVKSQFRSSMGI